MKKLLSIVLAVFIASPLMAQGQPAQWRYSFNSDGVATATYPGTVVTQGDIQATQLDINSQAYRQPPNYAGVKADSDVIVVQGTNAVPSTTAGAAGIFEKTSSALSFDAFAAVAFKKSSAANARASGVFGEAVDDVGGITTFAEGGRFQGTLLAGSSAGSSYGVICAAGAAAGAINPQYVIGCEGNSINQVGPNAPVYTLFNNAAFSAAFVATNGCAGCGAFKADAGIVFNPFNETPFRTAVYVAPGSTDDTGIAFGTGLTMQTGLAMANATLSYASITIPNNAPILAKNGAGNAELNILNLSSGNVLDVGRGAFRIDFANVATLPAYTVATLPTCNGAYQNGMAVVSDATSPTYNGALTGGGSIRIPVFCNGTSWTAH